MSFFAKGLKKGIRFFLFNFSSRFYKKSNITSIYFLGKNFFNEHRTSTGKTGKAGKSFILY